MPNRKLFNVSLLACAIAALGAASFGAVPVIAQTADAQSASSSTQVQHSINLPAGPLSSSLNALARQLKITLAADPALVKDLQAPAVTGHYSAQQALDLLLANSGLSATAAADGSYSIVVQPKSIGTLKVVKVTALATNELPQTYAGGQVARGGQFGLLGNQDMFETPYSLASYTSELIENQQSSTLADVVSNDASVHLVTAFGGGAETLVVRGFNAGGNSGSLFAGLPGLAHRRVTHVESLERVEVLKGAHSLLSGMVGSVGGITNLVPKRADAPLTRLTTSIEGKSKAGLHADISRRFGVDSQFGVRVNGIVRDGENSLESSEQDQQQVALATDYQSEKFRAEMFIDYADEKLSSPSQLFIPAANAKIPAAPEMKNAIQQPWEFNDRTFSRVVLKSEYDLNENWMLHGGIGFAEYEGIWLRTIGSNLQANGQFNQIASQQLDDSKNESARIGLVGKFETDTISHKLSLDFVNTAGEGGRVSRNVPGYSVVSNLYQPVFVARPTFTELPGSAPKESENHDQSFAIADTLGFAEDRLLVTVGVRKQSIHIKDYDRNSGAKINDYEEAATTPSVGVLYKLNPEFSIYSNYIESLEAGPVAPETAENAGEVFAPSKSDQIEFGGKWDRENIGLTFSVFEIAQPSGILKDDNFFTVDGEQRHRGIELNAFGNLSPNVRLLAGLTYIDAELTKTENGTFDGKKPMGVADISAVLNLEWDVVQWKGVTLLGSINHTGERAASSNNSDSLPSYQIVDIGARYKTSFVGKPLTLRAGIDNVFNENYWTIFSGSRVVYIGKPRTAQFSASMDF